MGAMGHLGARRGIGLGVLGGGCDALCSPGNLPALPSWLTEPLWKPIRGAASAAARLRSNPPAELPPHADQRPDHIRQSAATPPLPVWELRPCIESRLGAVPR